MRADSPQKVRERGPVAGQQMKSARGYKYRRLRSPPLESVGRKLCSINSFQAELPLESLRDEENADKHLTLRQPIQAYTVFLSCFPVKTFIHPQNKINVL